MRHTGGVAVGNDDPLLALYLARRSNLVRFLAARAGSLAAAEDLTQELYLKLTARERGGEEVSRVGGFHVHVPSALDRFVHITIVTIGGCQVPSRMAWSAQ